MKKQFSAPQMEPFHVDRRDVIVTSTLSWEEDKNSDTEVDGIF